MSVEAVQSIANTAMHAIEFVAAFLLLRGAFDLAMWLRRKRRPAPERTYTADDGLERGEPISRSEIADFENQTAGYYVLGMNADGRRELAHWRRFALRSTAVAFVATLPPQFARGYVVGYWTGRDWL